MRLDPEALDRHITGNYGEDQFRDHDCGYSMQDGPCHLDLDHPGRHTTIAYYCDSCGRMRRSRPVTVLVDANGDIDVEFCFMCVGGLT